MNNIIFASSVAGVETTYPVIPAGKHKPDWYSVTARNTYAEEYKRHMANIPSASNNHTLRSLYRCPGLSELFHAGYIVQYPWDIKISISPSNQGNGEMISFSCPSKSMPDQIIKNYATPFTVDTDPDNSGLVPKRPGFSGGMIKLDTGWHIFSPPGMRFLFLPPPYNENVDIDIVTGILTPSNSSTAILLQFFLNENLKEYTLKAGTPVLQIIPVVDFDVTHKCRMINAHEELWLQKRTYLAGHSFSSVKYKHIEREYIHHFRSYWKISLWDRVSRATNILFGKYS